MKWIIILFFTLGVIHLSITLGKMKKDIAHLYKQDVILIDHIIRLTED